MTDSELFEKLYNGGVFSLPILIKLTDSKAGEICLTNNNESITYNNKTYSVATFDYFPPNTSGSGASLSISSISGENELFEFIENSSESYTLSVVACIVDDEIQGFRNYKHYHGKATVNDKGGIDFNLDGDDRLEMTFTPYTYDNENNQGNA